jgi:hypothetical protein
MKLKFKYFNDRYPIKNNIYILVVRKRKLTLPNITLFTLPLQSIPSSLNIFKVDLFLWGRQIFRNLIFGFNFTGKEDCFFTSIGKYSDFYCPIKPNLTWPFSPFFITWLLFRKPSSTCIFIGLPCHAIFNDC